MCLEVMHLYTYDIFAEKLGFKIAWGCLAWYPFFYCSGAWPAVIAPAQDDLQPITCVMIAVLYFVGWALTRGANLQKYVYKTRAAEPGAERTLLGRWLLPMSTVPGTQLLCGGFWGLARHINYLGEILQGAALALPGSLVSTTCVGSALPWAYPLYYLAILIPRQADDEIVIRSKYGHAAFEAYAKRVPYRIVPGLW